MEGFTGPNGAMDCAVYFQGDVGASAHWCIDNYHPNQVICGVYEQYGAWTQASYNNLSFGIEQAGYASYSRDKWLNEQGTLLTTAAALMRQICDKYHIPIVSLSSSQAQDSWTPGVCDHVDFGSGGGGHHDCGSGYPMDKVIEWAKAGTGAPSGGQDMIPGVAVYNNKDYYAWVGKNGVIRYRGPDTNNQPVTIDSSASASGGCGMVISDGGWTFVTFTNAQGDPYVLRRAEGGEGGWQRFRLEDV
jgi:hypothetical protein